MTGPASTWAPQLCTAESHCPRCGATPGKRCLTDRPVHFERYDLWSGRCVADSGPPCFCKECVK